MSIFTRALSLIRREPPPVYLGGMKASDLLTLVTGWASTPATYTTSNYEARVKEGYHKNELLFACIDAKGNTAASAELCIKDKATGEEVEDHPVAQLMKQPNPLMSGFDFWYFTIANLDLAGAAYWQKIRNNAGQVIALWPMRPDWVSIIPDKMRVIGGYEYKPPGAGQPTRFDVADVLVFKHHDPGNILGTTSRVQIAARAVDVDNAETDLIRKIWESGGVPMGLLTSKLKLTDNDVKSIQERWAQKYGGSKNWHIPAVLDSDATYQRMQMNFAEMGLEFLDGRDETRICMVMGVPPIILGTTYGLSRSTFSNYAEARRAWWEDSLVPQYKKLADTFNAQLVAEIDPTVCAEWDFDSVPALRENEDAKWARATAALNAGGITVNMFLEEIGAENIGADGEYFLRSSAVVAVPVGNPADDNSEGTSSDLLEDDENEKPEKSFSLSGGNTTDSQRGYFFGVMLRHGVPSGRGAHEGASTKPDATADEKHAQRVSNLEKSRSYVASLLKHAQENSGSASERGDAVQTIRESLNPKVVDMIGKIDPTGRVRHNLDFVHRAYNHAGVVRGLSDAHHNLNVGHHFLTQTDRSESAIQRMLAAAKSLDDNLEEAPPLSMPAKAELAKFAAYVHQVKHETKTATINPRNPSGYEDFLFIHAPKGVRLAAKAYADVADPHELIYAYAPEQKAEQRVSMSGAIDPLAREKDAAESVMRPVVQEYLDKLKARVIANTRQAASHARKASRIPGELNDYLNYFDDKFWQDMLDLLDASMRPHIQDMASKGALEAAKVLRAKIGGGFDPAVFSTDAAEYAMKYTDKVLQKYNTTSRDGVGAILARWVGSEGATLQDLITALEQSPVFSLARVEMTAITETTRAFAQGEMIAGEVLAKEAGVPFKSKGSGLEPPLHPNCRCWVTTDPVYDGSQRLVAFDTMYHTAMDTVVCQTCAPYNGKYLSGVN